MCYIYTKGNKRAGMKDPIIEILQYNSQRKYFGTWSPAQASDAYHRSTRSFEPTKTQINTGEISVDDICDTLWNEMSYNPITFGKYSPFVIDGINSIHYFCKHEYIEKATDKAFVFAKIRMRLLYFMQKMNEFEPSFKETRKTDSCYMSIGTTNEYSKEPNLEYEILKCLRECIKEICSHNVNFYYNLKKTDPFAAVKLVNQIRERHPDLVRPLKIHNYSLDQRIILSGHYIDKVQKDQESLKISVNNKTEEIYDTQMKINTLQDYEEPVDSSHEEQILKQQNLELDALTLKLNEAGKKLKILIATQNYYQHS